MNIFKNIRKILSICLWLAIGAGIIVMMVAAVNSRSQKTCKGYDIRVNGQSSGKWFIDKEDILRLLTDNHKLKLKDRSLKSFELASLETKLEKEAWVKNAELFFDNNSILQVRIVQREPIARIFTATGASFYIDSAGHSLPLSDKVTVKLPVFTGFPSDGRKLKASDKQLVRDIKQTSLFLLKEPFWMAQTAQIAITHSREFEMIPTIGGHLVELGDASNLEQKFRRLMVFYKQVLSRAGMDKYERIKVQYDQQVVGVKKNS